MLEVIIGLIFTYLLLSLLATTINELLASWRNWRGYYLDEGLQKLLEATQDPSIYNKFINNPLFKQFEKHKTMGRVSQAPSYMSSTNFSSILFFVLKQQKEGSVTLEDFVNALPKDSELRMCLTQLKSELGDKVEDFKSVLKNVQSKEEALVKLGAVVKQLPDGSKAKATLEDLSGKGEKLFQDAEIANNLLAANTVNDFIETLPEGRLKTILEQLQEEAGNKVTDFKKAVEGWFDNVMDRTGGWYKRHMQMVTFFLGLGIAMGLNADTIQIYNHLSSNSSDRQEVVALATDFIQKNPSLPATGGKSMDQITGELHTLLNEDIAKIKNPLGIGWSNATLPTGGLDWALRLFGWIITALAISLGAPFWFDILQKVVRIRGSGNEAGKTEVVVNTNTQAVDPNKND